MKVLIVDSDDIELQKTKNIIQQFRNDVCFYTCVNDRQIMNLIENEYFDIALVDMSIPNINSIELCRKLQQKNAKINLIFTSASSNFAMDAFSLYASDYLIKPITSSALEKSFNHLRYNVNEFSEKLKVQCFGNFEVFYRGQQVHFARAKAKEIFAYLIDLNGSSATTGELCAILWEDSVKSEENRHYLRNLILDIRKALRECGCEDTLQFHKNQFAIIPDKVNCDLYEFLKQDAEAIKNYRGEYMKQYSWAEFRKLD